MASPAPTKVLAMASGVSVGKWRTRLIFAPVAWLVGWLCGLLLRFGLSLCVCVRLQTTTTTRCGAQLHHSHSITTFPVSSPCMANAVPAACLCVLRAFEGGGCCDQLGSAPVAWRKETQPRGWAATSTLTRRSGPMCVCVCVQSTPLDMQPRAMWSVSATQHSRHKARQHGSTQASLSSPSRGARRVESATPSGDGASNVCASWLSLVVVVRRQRLCECLSVVAATKAHKSPPKRQRGEISHSLSHLLGGCSSTFSTALTAWLPLLLLEQVEDVFAKRTSRSSFLDFSSFCM